MPLPVLRRRTAALAAPPHRKPRSFAIFDSFGAVGGLALAFDALALATDLAAPGASGGAGTPDPAELLLADPPAAARAPLPRPPEPDAPEAFGAAGASNPAEPPPAEIPSADMRIR